MTLILGIAVCILFVYIVTYFYNKNQVYEFDMDGLNAAAYSWKNGSRLLLTEQDVKKVNDVLNSISYENYAEKAREFNSKFYELAEYKNLILEKKADELLAKTDGNYVLIDGARFTRNQIEHIASMFEGYSMERTDELLFIYNVIRTCLTQAASFDEYRQYVVENSRKMAGISIFNSSWDTIREMEDDYSALADVRVKAYIFAGFEKLLDNPFGNLMAVVMAVFCSITAAYFIKGMGQRIYVVKRYAGFDLIFGIGLLILFICEAFAVDKTFGIEGLRYSIQSVNRFGSCMLEISIGVFLVIRTVLKGLFFYVLFLMLKLIFVSLAVKPKDSSPGSGKSFGHVKDDDHVKEKYRIWRILIPKTAVIMILTLTVIFRDTAFSILNVTGIEKILNHSYKTVVIFIICSFIVLIALSLFIEWRFKELLNLERKKIEQKYLYDIDEKYIEMRTLKHDMNNHLSAILMLMDEGKNDEAKNYIKELTGAASEASAIKNTGIRALDLLLWNKASQAVTENISLEYKLEDEYSGISISEYEICSLFANILDNAFEAVRKLEAGKRNIVLRTCRQMDMMCIFCENPYLSVQKENGRYVTTKAQKSDHSLGIKQIERIAVKHGGTLQIDDSNGIFRISVIMNI